MTLSEIEAIAKARTPGKWEFEELTYEDGDKDICDGSYNVKIDGYSDYICDQKYYNSAPSRKEDARFIAMAANKIDAFLSLARSVETAIDACEPLYPELLNKLKAALKELER